MVYAGDQQNFKTRSLHHLHRSQASFRSPEGEETLRPPRSDLRSPGIISKHGGFRAPDGDFRQKLKERMTWGDQALVSKARSFIFNRGLYTLSYT